MQEEMLLKEGDKEGRKGKRRRGEASSLCKAALRP